MAMPRRRSLRTTTEPRPVRERGPRFGRLPDLKLNHGVANLVIWLIRQLRARQGTDPMARSTIAPNELQGNFRRGADVVIAAPAIGLALGKIDAGVIRKQLGGPIPVAFRQQNRNPLSGVGASVAVPRPQGQRLHGLAPLIDRQRKPIGDAEIAGLGGGWEGRNLQRQPNLLTRLLTHRE